MSTSQPSSPATQSGRAEPGDNMLRGRPESQDISAKWEPKAAEVLKRVRREEILSESRSRREQYLKRLVKIQKEHRSKTPSDSSPLFRLPLEIREHILCFVFESAVDKDVEFNVRRHEYLRELQKVVRYMFLLSKVLHEQMSILDPYLIEMGGLLTLNLIDAHASWEGRFPIPFINNMATLLAKTHRQFGSDMEYVVNECRENFERRIRSEIIEWERKRTEENIQKDVGEQQAFSQASDDHGSS
ncbi:hypothetical protein Vi05172_g6187 [Venturia inaequalis]|uniref:Uncharacterized protein n=2 Tax=Venturia inaequalis TaxID=5025 RepID=A0A8H3VWI7_VENIN|nr:hypothetical protein EG327_000066 [Venturia inaequalis]RDI83890.1 hypothetical protein Vi05172_g6187 [Venturia inaequalis]